MGFCLKFTIIIGHNVMLQLFLEEQRQKIFSNLQTRTMQGQKYKWLRSGQIKRQRLVQKKPKNRLRLDNSKREKALEGE
jgi:hypothetical protein